METAHFWRLTPEDYFNCSHRNQVWMMAYAMAVDEMRAVEAYELDKNHPPPEQ